MADTDPEQQRQLAGDEDSIRRDEPVTIANEFASVRVAKVWTRNGERLEIEAPRLGHTIRLDPLHLESLSWQTPESLSRLLEQPFGPEDD